MSVLNDLWLLVKMVQSGLQTPSETQFHVYFTHLVTSKLQLSYLAKCSSHLDVLGALQQPLIKVSGVSKLFLLDLKVDVGLPQHLKTHKYIDVQ